MVESGSILSSPLGSPSRRRVLVRIEGGSARRAQIGQLRFRRKKYLSFFFFSSQLFNLRCREKSGIMKGESRDPPFISLFPSSPLFKGGVIVETLEWNTG